MEVDTRRKHAFDHRHYGKSGVPGTKRVVLSTKTMASQVGDAGATAEFGVPHGRRRSTRVNDIDYSGLESPKRPADDAATAAAGPSSTPPPPKPQTPSSSPPKPLSRHGLPPKPLSRTPSSLSDGGRRDFFSALTAPMRWFLHALGGGSQPTLSASAPRAMVCASW